VSVELPFSPVDSILRANAGDLRIGSDATEALAREIQHHGAALAREAATRADEDGRKTLMLEDFGAEAAPTKAGLTLPVAPVDRIARLDLDDRFRVSMDARVALAARLEEWAADVAGAAGRLARHAGRRTVKAEDVEVYLDLCE
jgi:histone H3/H4